MATTATIPITTPTRLYGAIDAMRAGLHAAYRSSPANVGPAACRITNPALAIRLGGIRVWNGEIKETPVRLGTGEEEGERKKKEVFM